MAGVRRFEDLVAWQAARRLHQGVAQLCRRPELKSQFKLTDQLLAASRSIGANIAEGFERFTPREFGKFLYIAKGSASEVRSLLTSAFDEGRLEKAEYEGLLAQAVTVSRLVGGLHRAVLKRYPKR